MKPVVASLLTSLMAFAAPSATAEVPHNVATLEVLPGWRQADGTHIAALRIRLAEGWKTYWRSPGDGGIPPRLSLAPSDNLSGARIAWPVPDVFDQNGLRSIGYEDDVTLPVAFRALDAEAPIRLSGTLEIGVCEEVCIPMTLSLSSLLPAGGQDDPVIRAALADRPMSSAEAGVGAVYCDIRPIEDGLEVSARVDLPSIAAEETAVLELSDRTVWISEADTRRTGGTLEAVVDMVPQEGAPFALDRSDIRITVIGDGKAVDIRGCG
ncbi:MAG: protein-disulfide reductase DsbD family protein [Paracoccaceae bacterium]|nr:protein-disulfide reductase DsbD family protein [Paracoccaceae bacterium]